MESRKRRHNSGAEVSKTCSAEFIELSPVRKRKTGETDLRAFCSNADNCSVGRTSLCGLGTDARPPQSLSSIARRLSLRRSGSHTSSSFRRHNSLIPLRKPLMNLQGSMRMKLAQTVQKNMMKANQDYSEGFGQAHGQLDYLRFMTALQPQTIAHDHEVDATLQQKIDHEMKMRDGSAKLLAACHSYSQLVAAAKNLTVSNMRLNALTEELYNIRSLKPAKESSFNFSPVTASVAATVSDDDGKASPSKAVITISDIRIPLMWKDTDHFRNKGDRRRYAVFCALRIGADIHDTEMLLGVDRSMTDLSFSTVVSFKNVDPGFSCGLEVYAHKMTGDLSSASTPQKIRRKIADVSLSVGRRLSGIKAGQNTPGSSLIGPKFSLIARASLKAADCTGSVGSFDLSLVDTDSATSVLPLFQHFCCRVIAELTSFTMLSMSGWLMLKKTEHWDKYWCKLNCMKIRGWKKQVDFDFVPEELLININKNTRLSNISWLDGETSASFDIETDSGIYSVMADDAEQLTEWRDILLQSLSDLKSWQQTDSALEERQSSMIRTMSLRRSCRAVTPAPSRSSTTSTVVSPMTQILSRLNVEMTPGNGANVRSSSSSSTVCSRRHIVACRKSIKQLCETDV